MPPPSAVPLFYRVAVNQLSQQEQLEVVGADSSGEVEPLIFAHHGQLWLSLISGHTDRKLEASSVALSKQLCIKPVAREAWPLESVREHWDKLILRSWIKEGGVWALYQQGQLASLRTPDDLLARYGHWQDGIAMSCGTVAAFVRRLIFAWNW